MQENFRLTQEVKAEFTEKLDQAPYGKLSAAAKQWIFE